MAASAIAVTAGAAVKKSAPNPRASQQQKTKISKARTPNVVIAESVGASVSLPPISEVGPTRHASPAHPFAPPLSKAV